MGKERGRLPRATEDLVVLAIRDNGCPMTLREIATSTGLTAYAAGRALTALAERRQVRPVEDGGITYQLLHL